MTRTAIVTGGTRGIGESIAVALQKAGHKVAATYAGNEDAAAKFTNATGIKAYKFDVADYAACEAGIAAIEADQGPTDILVSNAGVTQDAPFHKMSAEQWQKVISCDLDSITVNAIAPGYIGTEMVAALDQKVLDSIVGQIPVGRLGTPNEIADCVTFLASEQAGFITGSTLSINGGQYIAA